jgi:hypothetical protein
MKMDEIAGSKNDEYYTPEYAIKPILKYIKPNSTVWCPFDTEKSYYVKMLREAGHTVYATHIQDGFDFLTCDPFECDYIVSNPPYSIKGEILDYLFKLGIPFAMLIGVVGLFESQKRFQMFKNNPFEIMYFNKRVTYYKDYSEEKPSSNPPFSSVYLCSQMLPKQIVFEEIERK